MRKAIGIIASLGFLAESVYTLIQTILANQGVAIAVFSVLTSLALLSLILTTINEFKGHIRLKNKDKINKKIVNFIETSGETVILSRDLSWVTPEIISKLRNKVEIGEDRLMIFLPSENKKSKEIAEFADVRYFGDKIGKTNVDRLTSRFTIIHYGTDSVRITYPQEDTYWHINSEFSQGDAVLTLATDIIKLLDLITKS